MDVARGRKWLIAVGIVAGCFVLLVSARNLIGKSLVAAIAGSVTGTDVSIGGVKIGLGGISLEHLVVQSRSGEPIATIAGIEATYNLSDLITGKNRRFGLETLDVIRPQITLIRHRNGTFNIPLPQAAPSGGPAAPFNVTGKVVGATVVAIDRMPNFGPPMLVTDAHATFAIDQAGRSSYTAGLTFHDGGRSYPIAGSGRLDASSGLGMQRWSIPAMPVARLIDFAAANSQFRLINGSISGANVRIFSLPLPGGASQTGVIATTLVRDVEIASPSLLQPVRDLHGRLDVSTQGAILEDVTGALAGIPVHASGGVYDLSRPMLRVALRMRGNLATLRGAVAQMARLPIAGNVELNVLAEGAATSPLVMISVRSPEIRYLHAPIRDGAGLVAYENNELDILDAHAYYAHFAAQARGRILLTPRTNDIEVLAHASAPANTVPYATDVVPGMPIEGTLLATASDPKLIETHGVLEGSSSSQRLAAAFAVTSKGAGSVGPLLVTGSRGELFAQVALDHPSNDHAGFLHARDLRVASVNVPPLPGFPVRALPPVRGTFDADVLGTLDQGRPAAAGTARLRGSFRGYDVDAPLALVYGSNQAIVQITGARFSGAHVKAGLSGTVALTPRSVHVLAIDARANGGEALASGTLGNNDPIALSAENLPLLGGALSLAAIAHADLSAPSLSSTVLARGMRYDRLLISGMSSLQYAKGTLGIGATSLGAGAAYVAVSGSVGGLAIGKRIVPRYDVEARVRAADAHSLVAIAAPARANLVTGSIDGDAYLRGSGTSPDIRGSLSIPEGSVNGLAFADLHGSLDGTMQRMTLRNGGVTVGTTMLAFSGSATRTRDVDLTVSAPHANLADFDDLFNAGDMLDGRGNLSATLAYAPGAIASSGSATFNGLRYARLNIGNAEAGWSTTGTRIALALLAGGAAGKLQTSGTIDSSTHALDLAMTVSKVDLSTWLPQFGFTEPVSGDFNATGYATGVFPNVDSSFQAQIVNGRAGPFPLERATIALHTTGGAGRIDAANVTVPYLTATAAGTFGFHANDPLAVSVHATSPNIGLLAHEATGKTNALAGALDTTLRLSGTRLAPQIADQSTLTSLRYDKLTIPRVVAQVSASQHWLAITQAEADLQHGRALLVAQVPLQLSPPGVPRDEPFTAAVTADDLDLTSFASVLPSGTHLAGRIDGTVRATGELDNPAFDGLLTLDDASYSGPQESTPIAGGAQLAFAGRRVTLQNASFRAGGGTVVMSAIATVPSVQDLNAIALSMRATATNAVVDLPQYFKGRIDGTLVATHPADAALTIGGTMTLSSARVPMTAFVTPSSTSAAKPLPVSVAFRDFTIAVGQDVRVQSPNVDVGATGHLTLNGPLAHLAPSGSFLATGGTVSFYRTFQLQHANVTFAPSSGIIPDVNAVATTYVTNPDTEIRLHVTGPATGMNIAFASQPPYNRSQILGLLVGAQAFGAVQGVNATGGGTFSATSAVSSLAVGQVNTLFTRSMLEPLNTALASTFGFSNVQLTSNLAQGQYGAQFVKAFGHNLQAIFNQSFGYPQRTTMTLAMTMNNESAVRLSAYTQPDVGLFLSPPPALPPPDTVGQAAQLQLLQRSGTNGFSLVYQRRSW